MFHRDSVRGLGIHAEPVTDSAEHSPLRAGIVLAVA